MKEQYEYVRSLKLAGHCMMNGFRIIEVRPNYKVTNKDVYVFKKSEELSKCILKYIESTKEKNNGINITTNGRSNMARKNNI